MSHEPNSRGFYTHEIRIPIKGGRFPIPMAHLVLVKQLDFGRIEASS